jgi:hypothetical protein
VSCIDGYVSLCSVLWYKFVLLICRKADVNPSCTKFSGTEVWMGDAGNISIKLNLTRQIIRTNELRIALWTRLAVQTRLALRLISPHVWQDRLILLLSDLGLLSFNISSFIPHLRWAARFSEIRFVEDVWQHSTNALAEQHRVVSSCFTGSALFQ